MTYRQVPDLINDAENNIYSLEDCDLKQDGGLLYRPIRDTFVWKPAEEIRLYFQNYLSF